MIIKTYKAFQPLTSIDTPNLKLARLGDFYPSADEITATDTIAMPTTVQLPEEVAAALGFAEVENV